MLGHETSFSVDNLEIVIPLPYHAETAPEVINFGVYGVEGKSGRNVSSFHDHIIDSDSGAFAADLTAITRHGILAASGPAGEIWCTTSLGAEQAQAQTWKKP